MNRRAVFVLSSCSGQRRYTISFGERIMNTYWKFGAIVVVIIGALAWLAMGGVTESKTYYKEIKEVTAMGDRAQSSKLRVNGYVQQGSIVRNGAQVSFILHQTPGMLDKDPV